MAVKRMSLFDYMKKYELPMPLWFYKPELEQQDPRWKSLSQQLMSNRLQRFLRLRTEHERQLYYKLFPLPAGWTGWIPQKEEALPETAYTGRRKLKLLRWEPDCPQQADFPEEKSLYIFAGDSEDIFSPTHWDSFFLKMDPDSTGTTECRSPEHMLILGYALYRGNRKLHLQLCEAMPHDQLWQDTLRKALRCRTPGWRAVLPHLLGLGLYRKFSQSNPFRQMLQQTAEQPIVYIDPEDSQLGGTYKDGRFCGENLYGKALMQVRSELNRIYDNIVLCMGQPKKQEDFPLDFPF